MPPRRAPPRGTKLPPPEPSELVLVDKVKESIGARKKPVKKEKLPDPANTANAADKPVKVEESIKVKKKSVKKEKLPNVVTNVVEKPVKVEETIGVGKKPVKKEKLPNAADKPVKVEESIGVGKKPVKKEKLPDVANDVNKPVKVKLVKTNHPTGSSTATPTPIAFPDSSAIGDAFKNAIAYMSAQHHFAADKLDAEAKIWLHSAVTTLLQDLGKKFQELHDAKDNPLLFPSYVLNPDESLNICTVKIPYVLSPYNQLFQQYLSQLLESCGLSAKTSYSSFEIIVIKIKFDPSLRVGGVIDSHVFDAAFQDEFFNRIGNLSTLIDKGPNWVGHM